MLSQQHVGAVQKSVRQETQSAGCFVPLSNSDCRTIMLHNIYYKGSSIFICCAGQLDRLPETQRLIKYYYVSCVFFTMYTRWQKYPIGSVPLYLSTILSYVFLLNVYICILQKDIVLSIPLH